MTIWRALGLESEPGGGPDTLAARKNGGTATSTHPRFNFIEGSNISLTVADDFGDDDVDITITASSAAGAPTFASTEKDIAACPCYSGTFDITGLSGLTAAKRVLIWQEVGPYTGKGDATGSIDEVEMDMVTATGYVVDATTIRAYWTCPQRVMGNVKFQYLVGG